MYGVGKFIVLLIFSRIVLLHHNYTSSQGRIVIRPSLMSNVVSTDFFPLSLFIVFFFSFLKSDHLNILRSEGSEQELEQKLKIVQKLKTMPIAIATAEANEQHYEVPAKFYDLCLGPRKKYSSGYWPTPDTTFLESEIAMLNKYCDLAGTLSSDARPKDAHALAQLQLQSQSPT